MFRLLDAAAPDELEVLSPSTRLKDLRLKHAVYEESGVASYWVVDPAAPSLRGYELTDGT